MTMIDPRKTHKILMEKIKMFMKDEVRIEIGKTYSGTTFFYNDLTVYFRQEKFDIVFNAAQQKMFLMRSEYLEKLFHFIFLNNSDVKKLNESLNEKGRWYIFLSIILEIVAEISIGNFKQSKEYKLRSLYDKKYEQLFDNLSCLYIEKLNKYS
jgi:hypothetical protein